MNVNIQTDIFLKTKLVLMTCSFVVVFLTENMPLTEWRGKRMIN